MYFLETDKGEVCIYDDRLKVYKIKETSSLVPFKKGDIFGETEVLLEPVRICDVKCFTYTETFKIDSNEFISLLKCFNDEKAEIYKIAAKKLKSIKSLQDLVTFFAEKVQYDPNDPQVGDFKEMVISLQNEDIGKIDS